MLRLTTQKAGGSSQEDFVFGSSKGMMFLFVFWWNL